MLTAIIIMDTSHQFSCRQFTLRFDDRFLARNPVRFDPIQPRTFRGQLADKDADTTIPLGHFIVRANPVPHLATDVPRGVVPDQEQRCFALLLQPFTGPGQKLCRDTGDWTASDKAQPDLFPIGAQESVTSDGLRIRVLLFRLLCQEPHRLVWRPRLQVRLLKARPPDFIFIGQNPVWMPAGEADQRVRT